MVYRISVSDSINLCAFQVEKIFVRGQELQVRGGRDVDVASLFLEESRRQSSTSSMKHHAHVSHWRVILFFYANLLNQAQRLQINSQFTCSGTHTLTRAAREQFQFGFLPTRSIATFFTMVGNPYVILN